MTLATELHQLERSQLVRRADEAYMAYIFKHVLVQETAYSSLLKSDRQRLHQSVAASIESAEPERLDENAARLQQHYAASGDYDKAIAYARRAGAYAAGMFANAEAIEHYNAALDLLKQHGGSPDDFKSVYLARGHALQETSAFALALENYHALETLGQTRGDESLELAGLLERATLHAIPSSVHDPQEGARLNARALALAQKLQDRRAECKTLWNLLLIAYFDVEPALAVEYGERALALARELGWHEMEAYILNDMSRPLISIGPPERVLALLEEARILFVAQNNLPLLADNLGATSQVLGFYGNYDRSGDVQQQAEQLSRTISNAWTLAYSCFSALALAMARGQISHMRSLIRELETLHDASQAIMVVYVTRGWLAEISRVLGDDAAALAHSRMLAEWAQQGYLLGHAWTMGELILDLVRNDRLDEAQVYLARVRLEKLTDFYSFGPMSVALGEGELALALQDGEWALRVADELLEKLIHLGIEFYQAGMYILRARALILLGRFDDAETAFARASVIGERIPARRVLWEGYALWGDLAEQRGNHLHALELRQHAAEYVMYIADQWDTPALRKQFLNQPRVRALFDSIAAVST